MAVNTNYNGLLEPQKFNMKFDDK